MVGASHAVATCNTATKFFIVPCVSLLRGSRLSQLSGRSGLKNAKVRIAKNTIVVSGGRDPATLKHSSHRALAECATTNLLFAGVAILQSASYRGPLCATLCISPAHREISNPSNRSVAAELAGTQVAFPATRESARRF